MGSELLAVSAVCKNQGENYLFWNMAAHMAKALAHQLTATKPFVAMEAAHVCDFFRRNILDKIQATNADVPVTITNLRSVTSCRFGLPKRYDPHLLQL